MDVAAGESGVYVFESFKLDPVRRIVLRDGVKVNLTPRLFEILLYLVRHHERVVGRDELQQDVWGSRAIEGNNLAVAISSLRKALQDDDCGDGLVATIPGQGYRLAAAVTFEPANHAPISSSFDAPLATCPYAGPARRRWWRSAAFAGACLLLAIVSAAAIWHLSRPIEQTAGRAAPKFAPPAAFSSGHGVRQPQRRSGAGIFFRWNLR
jgi:DNA-binding winged helix-turn-helix (wHTH) protein